MIDNHGEKRRRRKVGYKALFGETMSIRYTAQAIEVSKARR